MNDPKEHWEAVYHGRTPDTLSWYQSHATRSVALIRAVCPDRTAPIVDVGGGASVLVDDLLDLGYRDLSLLDLSGEALALARSRLGSRASDVHWLETDVLTASLPQARYSIWHDRAVFHFLTREEDRRAYVSQVLRSVRPGGFVLVATFGPTGPTRCSGLDVVRYTPAALHTAFGSAFELLRSEEETHRTPDGRQQPFVYCLCRLGKIGSARNGSMPVR